jgi:hypothetical protein
MVRLLLNIPKLLLIALASVCAFWGLFNYLQFTIAY